MALVAKVKLSLLAAALALLLLPSPSHAAQGCDIRGLQSGLNCVFNLQQQSGVRNVTPAQLVLNVVRIILSVAGVLAVATIVIAGVMYMMAAGDESKAEKAKHAIMYAIIGLLVIGAAIVIVNLVISFFF